MKDVWNKIAAELQRLLAPYGFRRSRLTFIETQNPEVVRTVLISRFRWNTQLQRRFQLVLSIYLATGQAGEFAFPGRAARHSLVFQKDAGYLWGEEPFFYVVPEATRGEALYERLRRDIKQHILPFFELCHSLDAVIKTLDAADEKTGRNQFSTQMAIALARLGRMKESSLYFLKTPGDPETVRRLAAQYGVDL